MKILSPTPAGIQETLAVLQSGGVVAHATETCYGLACDMTNLSAVQKVFAIKKRPHDQPISALFASVSEAKKWVEWNHKAQELADEYLPGPLTLILPLQEDKVGEIFPKCHSEHSRTMTQSHQKCAPFDCAQGDTFLQLGTTLGVRISSYPLAQELAEKYPRPISTTSANVHKMPNPYSVDDMIAQFGNQEYTPDLILDSGNIPEVPASKIINVADSRVIRS